MEPETALWTAVLNLAVRDTQALVQKVQKDPNLWANPLFRSEVLHLQRYFQSKSMELGGFGFICDLMGLDPDQAAQHINRKYFQHLTLVNRHNPTTTHEGVNS